MTAARTGRTRSGSWPSTRAQNLTSGQAAPVVRVKTGLTRRQEIRRHKHLGNQGGIVNLELTFSGKVSGSNMPFTPTHGWAFNHWCTNFEWGSYYDKWAGDDIACGDLTTTWPSPSCGTAATSPSRCPARPRRPSANP